jgi:hypothetical protein
VKVDSRYNIYQVGINNQIKVEAPKIHCKSNQTFQPLFEGAQGFPYPIPFIYFYLDGFVVLVGAGDKWITGDGMADSRQMWGAMGPNRLYLRRRGGRVIHMRLWMESDMFVHFIHRLEFKFICGLSQKYTPIYGGISF